MNRYLLDANLSPKTARYLTTELQLDVKSLHVVGLASLPDHDIAQMAQREKRVIITLDRDFSEYYRRQKQPNIGVIYLDLPSSLRFIPTINQILFEFFSEHAESVDLEGSLVVLTGDTVRITHSAGH